MRILYAPRKKGGQQSLLIHNPATKQEQIAQGALPDAEKLIAVNLLDRDVELIGVLATFGELNQYGGYKKAIETSLGDGIRERYGAGTAQVTAGVERNRGLARREAKWGFARASGMFALIDALPTVDAEGAAIDNQRRISRIRSRFARFFAEFQLDYDGVRNNKDRVAYQKQLLKNVRLMQDTVTHDNREQGLRPHRKRPKKTLHESLGTRERLKPLQDDARAGFYPVTHREKNKVLEDLDYLDNPAYPLGTINRQLEIYNHSARLGSAGSVLPDGPERAAYSLMHEQLDYFYDARDSLILLRALNEEMEFMMNRKNGDSELLNPHLAVGLTSLHKNHSEALVRVLRFVDIGKYAHGDGTRTFADPLRTRTDRWAKQGAGKHKKVHDQYTQPDSKQQKAKIDAAVAAMPVKLLRDSVAPSVLDQTKRVLFYATRIQEIANTLDQTTFRDTRDLALVALGNIELEFLPHAAA